MEKRIAFRVELTLEARRCLLGFVERNGMKQVVTMSRLIQWFTSQPPAIQAAVLARDPAQIAPDLAKRIIQNTIRPK